MMAQLPPNGEWLVQQQEHDIVVFRRCTEEEIARADIRDPSNLARAQGAIWRSDLLTDEQKSFASFWCGYFYGCSIGGGQGHE